MVNSDLTPLTEYFVFVKDKFGDVYFNTITTTNTGQLSFTDLLFENLFNPVAGVFQIWVSADVSGTPKLVIYTDEDDVDFSCIVYKNICD